MKLLEIQVDFCILRNKCRKAFKLTILISIVAIYVNK